MSSDVLFAALFGGIFALFAVTAPFIAWRRGLITTDGRRIWPRSSPEEFTFYAVMLVATLAGLSLLYSVNSPWKSPALMLLMTLQQFFTTMYYRRHPWKRRADFAANGSLFLTKVFAGMALLMFVLVAIKPHP